MNAILQALLNGDPHGLGVALVAVSMLVYIVSANLAWYLGTWTESQMALRLQRFAASPYTRGVYQVLRGFYYVVLPYIALWFGWLDERAMGLGYLDWADGLRWTIVLALAAWILLMFVWVPYLRATSNVPVRFSNEVLSWSRRIVEVVYMQLHWAFYRAACILLLTNLFKDDQAIYWGTSIGLALTFLEAWADPRVRRNLTHVGIGEVALWNAGQAIINTVGFVLTRNVWLLALVQLALEFSVPHLRAVPKSLLPPVPVRRTSAANALKRQDLQG